MKKKDNYTYEDYFGNKNNEEINDAPYKKAVAELLNNTQDEVKRLEMIEMIKEQNPKCLHWCSSKGEECPYYIDIKRNYD